MGAGKTTVGRRLAEALALDFVDSDAEIELRTGVDIPLIFEMEGEAGFRRREQQVIADLCTRNHMVLATGGGAVLFEDNRRALSQCGFVVYLRASIEHQLARTERCSKRPLLRHGDRRETLQRLFQERDPLYREIADLVLATDRRNARALCREIQSQLPQSTAAS